MNPDCQQQLIQIQGLYQAGSFKEAKKLLEMSRAHCGNVPAYWLISGQVELQLGKLKEARKYAIRLLKQEHGNAQALSLLASIYRELRDEEKELKTIQKLMQSVGKNHQLRLTAAGLYLRLGQKENARDLFREVTDGRPEAGNAWYGLATLRDFSNAQADIASMESALKSRNITSSESMLMHYALGKFLESIQEYEPAFQHFMQGNNMRRGRANLDFTSRLDSALSVIHDFTSVRFEKYRHDGHPGKEALFIVGMPRSGTTLTEQILDRHSKVTGIGEARHMGATIMHRLQKLQADNSVLESLAESEKNVWKNIARDYLEITRRRGVNTPKSVDKMPLNANLLGLVKLAFPNAGLIYCKRDRLDTAVSCFTTAFREDMLAYSLEELAQLFALQEALMAHWINLFGDEIYIQQYELQVTEPEKATRTLLEATGLNWEAACLSPEKSSSIIRTASVSQVREKIYTRSINRKEAYLPYMQGFLDAFEKAENYLKKSI